MALSAPSFTKLPCTQYIFVEISCTEFDPNRAKSIENTEKYSFTPLWNMPFTKPVFTNLTITQFPIRTSFEIG
jgi:hypothetical protein